MWRTRTLPPGPEITQWGQVNKGMCWTTENIVGGFPAAVAYPFHLQSVQNGFEAHSAPFLMDSEGLLQG